MACCLRSMACCCLTKAGKLCFVTRMGCRFQNSKGWKALFCNVDGVRVPKQPPTWKALFCNRDGVRVPKQPRLENSVLQLGWGAPWLESFVLHGGLGAAPKKAKAGKFCFATWMGYGFKNSKSWKALFCNLDGVQVPKQPRLESSVLQRGWGAGSKTTMAGKHCFATWMGYGFQNSQGWKALFCKADGVQVPKHPRLESSVLQRGWGADSKTAKAGKLCFAMWMGYGFQNSPQQVRAFKNQPPTIFWKLPKRHRAFIGRPGIYPSLWSF